MTEPESPWMFAKRLLAEGVDVATIQARLEREHGLTAEDARLLLDAPVAAPPPRVVNGLNLALGLVTIAGGLVALIISRFLAAFLIFAGATRVATAFKKAPGNFLPGITYATPLRADDPAPRCANHSDFASVFTCPVCGAFCCAACAPPRVQKKGRCIACTERKR